MTKKKIPKIYVHYNTFDALCKRAVELPRLCGRGIIFSSQSKRLFITKMFKIYAGNWYDVRTEIMSKGVKLRIGNPFTKDMKFASHCDDLYIRRDGNGDDMGYVDDFVLFEIEIVSDNIQEDISGIGKRWET